MRGFLTLTVFLWKAPYRIIYKGPLKPGKNTIKVKPSEYASKNITYSI